MHKQTRSPPISNTTTARHYNSLDGVRGLAALCVVCWHFCLAFAPSLVGYQAAQGFTLGKIISDSPLFLALSGEFAVCIFFVLSGFVLSLSFFKYRSRAMLMLSAVKRYFRLMIPAAGAILLAYIAMKLGGQYIHHAAAGLSGSHWLAQYWNDPAHFGSALYQGMIGIFATGNAPYNTNLWTMRVEFLGSLLIFAFLALAGTWKWRPLGYLALAVLFANSYYLAFVLGMALCDIWQNYPAIKDRLGSKSLALIVPIGLVLSSWHVTLNAYPSFFDRLSLPYFGEAGTEQLAHILGALLLIIAVLQAPLARRFFESKPLRYLGGISFSLYLIHFIVIYTVSSLLFAFLLPQIGYAAGLGLTLALSLPVIFVVAHYYTRYVDTPSTAWSKSIGLWLLAVPSKARKLARRLRRTRVVYRALAVFEQT